MEKSLLERIKLIKKNGSIRFVDFYNDGSIGKDEYSETRYIDTIYNSIPVESIERLMCYAAEQYATKNDFDRISVDLLLGLVYKVEDVDLLNNIIEGAEPLDNIVSYRTGDTRSYIGDHITNETKLENSIRNYKGYANYEEFISLLKKRGITFNGPTRFKDFKKAILSGDYFNIELSLDLKEEPTQVRRLFRRK